MKVKWSSPEYSTSWSSLYWESKRRSTNKTCFLSPHSPVSCRGQQVTQVFLNGVLAEDNSTFFLFDFSQKINCILNETRTRGCPPWTEKAFGLPEDRNCTLVLFWASGKTDWSLLTSDVQALDISIWPSSFVRRETGTFRAWLGSYFRMRWWAP